MVLTGGTKTIASWGQGNVYYGSDPNGRFVQGHIPEPVKAPALLDSSGRIVSRTHPQYENYDVTQIVSVRDHGAKGDGVTDDTDALKAIFEQACKDFSRNEGNRLKLGIDSSLTVIKLSSLTPAIIL